MSPHPPQEPVVASRKPDPALSPPIIGIVGGVGPYAGLDLQRKILEQTIAARDQDHLPVISVSWPGPILDRTDYLLGHVVGNPAYPILAQLRLLANAGATVAGIPCNTVHAPAIFNVIRAAVNEFERPLRLLHMIEEAAAYLHDRFPTLSTVGVLSTTGTWRTRLYPVALEPLGFRVVVMDETLQTETIHPAVYDPEFGIKAVGRATVRARANLDRGIIALHEMGAEAIILGCTEMPLAYSEKEWDGLPLIDPTWVLARALIREVAPAQLR